MRGLFCVTFLLAACRGDADGVGSPDNGSRHQLRDFPRFTCHLGGAHELRLGVIADHDFISYQRDGEEGFKREVRQLVQDASVVYNEQLGFVLSIEHLVLPSAFPNNDFLENRSFCYNDEKRTSGFNEFRKVYLADKPAGLWFLWTTCLRIPGMVSHVSNVCMKESPVGIVTSMNRRQFIHEVGHSFGALHPPPPLTMDLVDVMLPGNFPIFHFKVRHESNVCDVLRHSLNKIDVSEIRSEGGAFSRREEMLSLDLCWKIPSGAKPSDQGSKTQKEVGRQPETNTVQTGQPQSHQPKTGRQPGRQSNPGDAPDCSKLEPGWASCEKQNAGCETHYYPLPKKCVSTTSRSQTQKEVGRQPETNTVQTGQPQSHQPKTGRQPGPQSNPGDAPGRDTQPQEGSLRDPEEASLRVTALLRQVHYLSATALPARTYFSSMLKRYQKQTRKRARVREFEPANEYRQSRCAVASAVSERK